MSEVRIGDVFKLNCGVSVTVTDTKGSKYATVTDYNATVKQVRVGHLQQGCVPWPRKYQKVPPVVKDDTGWILPQKTNYVYLAHSSGELVYVGRGSGNRYRHVFSGRSSSHQLNCLYHDGKPAEVSFHSKSLTYSESVELETKLILELKPKYNIVGAPV